MAVSNHPRVVIIGAGFGGLWAARALAHSPVDVLLIDRHNYHTFLALLYQVAAAELEPENIAYPIRNILRKLPNASFSMAEVKDVDFDRQIVKTEGSVVPYDFLILAAGSVSHFFGIPGTAEYAFPLKNLEEGINLRNHILSLFERALQENNPQRRKQALTFTVVGGGPTGVEFAGALSELVYGLLLKDYPALPAQDVRIVLLEAMDGLLSGLPERCRTYTLERLQMKMGVEVHLKSYVSRITREAVYLKDGTVIPTETVVWTAGVYGSPLAQKLDLPVNNSGRVTVLPTLQVPEHPNVYVVGDLAYLEQDGRPLPMLAQVAMQEGVTAAQNIVRQINGNGQPLVRFRYKDLGAMVTIGRHSAVARLDTHAFTGLSAWLLWLVVHLIRLVGFRNRLLVLINWTWSYFLYERAARLILPSELLPVSEKTAYGAARQRFASKGET